MRSVCVLVLMAGRGLAADVPPKELPPGRAMAGRDQVAVGKVSVGVYSVELNAQSLTVKYRVTTNDKAAKVSYQAVRPCDIPAVDNFGISYRTVRHKLFNEPYRLFVAFQQPAEDYLNIETPITSAEFVDIDIPGNVLGEKEPIKFRVPREMWDRDAKKVQPKKK